MAKDTPQGPPPVSAENPDMTVQTPVVPETPPNPPTHAPAPTEEFDKKGEPKTQRYKLLPGKKHRVGGELLQNEEEVEFTATEAHAFRDKFVKVGK